MTKCCGYSAIVLIPKYSCLSDLCSMINMQFGPYTFSKTYYVNNNVKTYLYTLPGHITIRQLLSQLTLSYSVDQCQWCVYQLYYDTECCVSHV